MVGRGWGKHPPGPCPLHTPHLNPQVEVAVDGNIIGSTALAFCGKKEGTRTLTPIRRTYPRTRPKTREVRPAHTTSQATQTRSFLASRLNSRLMPISPRQTLILSSGPKNHLPLSCPPLEKLMSALENPDCPHFQSLLIVARQSNHCIPRHGPCQFSM